MRGEDDQFAFFDFLADDIFEYLRVDRIESAERFIENQDIGIADERLGNLNFLLIAFGQCFKFWFLA
jgi:hypothetical protein